MKVCYHTLKKSSLVLLIILLVLTACGGGDDAEGEEAGQSRDRVVPTMPAAQFTAVAAQTGITQTIDTASL